ncbi:chymotrypsinogen 2-like [Physella acuta]|uniref:chymotrypsinogen 2-like n=1 Tax=Physella acuta TaxID=109671 RepID=UPI0027DBD021|nr:chymotrypsinogen 2-like [Physella acuta]
MSLFHRIKKVLQEFSDPADECGIANNFRIIGGSYSSACEFPWMVLVHDIYHDNKCGGAILDQTHVLTAAHCVARIKYTIKPEHLRVYTGSSVLDFENGLDAATIRYVTLVTPHEDFGVAKGYLANDLAILTLSEPIQFDPCHGPICLANGTKSTQKASRCKVMGWGLSSTNQNSNEKNLKSVDVAVVSDATCRSIYKTNFDGTIFCAGSRGNGYCYGDAGGPLVCKESDGRYYAYGIAIGNMGDCSATAEFYTKVSSYFRWIKEKTAA